MYVKLFVAVFDNTIDPFIPAFWARESLIVLVENMVAANLVHRDFEPIVANYGDTINTRKPAELAAYRKTNADSVTVQDVTATNVQVVLNQHIHTSFLIKDGEESKSMISLVNEYLRPAVIAMSRFVDRLVLGQYSQFIDNQAGFANGLSTSNARAYLLDLRNKANIQKIPDEGRALILNNNSETTLLNLDLFTQAQQVGDNGTALRKGFLGEKFGFSTFRAYNMATYPVNTPSVTGAVNHSGGYAAGYAGSIVVNGFTGDVGAIGAWVVVDGGVYRIKAENFSTNTIGITLHRPLDRAVANSAVVTIITPTTVNFGAGYAAGYAKAITITTGSLPAVGQPVTFKTTVPDTYPYAGTSATSPVYTVIDTNGTTLITLDRPLEIALADTNAVNFGPAGSYNFTFHKNAISLVCRPLALPRQGVGALSAVMNANGLSMRSTITYDGHAQGHLVTLDMLLGVKALDENLGAVLLG